MNDTSLVFLDVFTILKLRRLIRRLETQFGVSIDRPDVVTIVVLFLEDWPLYIDMLFISIVENCV